MNIYKYITAAFIAFLTPVSFGADDIVIGPELFCGIWYTCSSNTELFIKAEGSQFEISMTDKSYFNCKIIIKNISWDGHSLCFTSHCIENGWTIEHRLTIESLTQLQDIINGSINKTNILWTKNKCKDSKEI